MIARSPSTFVVGAGAVATTLAGALRKGGVPVLGLWARKPAAARAAGAAAGVAAYSAAPPDLILEAEVLLIAVRDPAIEEVAKMLVGTGLVTGRHIFLHCSGARAADVVFASVAAKVGGVGTLHPLRAIRDPQAAMGAMRGTVFGVQGDEVGKRAAGDLCRAIGGEVLELDGEAMARYHAAAAMSSNFVVALLDMAATELERAGVPRRDGRAALLALARGSLDNIAREGLPEALTGPIRRGDVQTVRRHLEAVSDIQVAEVYRVLGRHAVSMARQLGAAGGEELAEVAEALAGPAGGES